MLQGVNEDFKSGLGQVFFAVMTPFVALFELFSNAIQSLFSPSVVVDLKNRDVQLPTESPPLLPKVPVNKENFEEIKAILGSLKGAEHKLTAQQMDAKVQGLSGYPIDEYNKLAPFTKADMGSIIRHFEQYVLTTE